MAADEGHKLLDGVDLTRLCNVGEQGERPGEAGELE